VQRADLYAPAAGHIARRNVQIGQRVQAGAGLMSVVALEDVWVDANFKESQLKSLRLGQPVTLVADVYGKEVTYRGRIDGVGAGTGAAFALLPAQNASGNWIKVVQRLPVRIALERAEVAAHPLRVGLSMRVSVDVSRQDGPMLPKDPRPMPASAAAPEDPARVAADLLVRRIIAENSGKK
jgi:membrane fusion protein (multidrug efflux system)